MEKVGFIGAYDKSDLMMYIAKILIELEKKVLIIDSTINQKTKYIVPAISPTTSYVTEFEKIDIAVGFYNESRLAQYLGADDLSECGYDYVFIDIDNPEMVESFEIENASLNYFVTSFDLYSLKRGIEILSGLKNPIELVKVLYAQKIYKEDDDYLNFLALGKKIKWNPERVYITLDEDNESRIIENQRIEKLKFKELASDYKEALMYMAQTITKNNNSMMIKKILKQM